MKRRFVRVDINEEAVLDCIDKILGILVSLRAFPISVKYSIINKSFEIILYSEKFEIIEENYDLYRYNLGELIETYA